MFSRKNKQKQPIWKSRPVRFLLFFTLFEIIILALVLLGMRHDISSWHAAIQKNLFSFIILSIGAGIVAWLLDHGLQVRQASEQEIRKLLIALEQSPFSVVITDNRGYIEYANEKYLQKSATTRDGLSGTPLFPPEQTGRTDHLYSEIHEAIRTGSSWHGEISRKNSSGETIWEHVSISPLTPETAGSPQNFIATIEDITRKKHADQELNSALTEAHQASSELEKVTGLQAAILENSLVGIGLLKNGLLQWTNPRLSEMLGLDAASIKGTDISIFFESTEVGQAVLGLARKAQRTHENFDIECRMKSGKHQFFWGRLYGKGISHGDIEDGILFLLEDITERKEFSEALQTAKEEAENAATVKSRFLAKISHEIRTPLNSIIGFSEILNEQLRNPKQRQYLEAIVAGSKTLRSLITDILDISRMEVDKMPVNYTRVDVVSILRDIELMYAGKAKRRDLELSLRLGPDIPEQLILDETRLRQILINLVDNAFKFTEKGFIRLSLEALPATDEDMNSIDLHLKVEDSGIGVPVKEKEKIFNAFEQHGDHRHKQYSGAGLGLAITRSLAELLGGSIRENGIPGHGAAFEIRLKNIPIASPPEETAITKLVDPNQVIFEPATLLHAAPDKIDHDIIKEFLNSPGLNVIRATDCRHSLDKIAAFKPDLILLASEMQNINHELLARQIQDHFPELPAVAYASGPMPLAEERKIKTYCKGFLAWPVSRSTLITELCRLLPYKLKEEIAEQNQKQAGQTDRNQYKLLVQLHNQLNIWENIVDTMIVNDIEKFALEINDLGGKLGNDDLIKWSRNLQFLSEKFDMEKLTEALQHFPQLVKQAGAPSEIGEKEK